MTSKSKSETDAGSRVQLLEDLESIRCLKSLNAKYLDLATNERSVDARVRFVNQFKKDAVWTSDVFGSYEGNEAIAAFLDSYQKRVSLCLHYMMGHLIDVARDGKSAKGYWVSWEPMTVDGKAMILAGRYNDEYERAGDGWLFKSVRLDVNFLAYYDRGWAKEKIPADWKW